MENRKWKIFILFLFIPLFAFEVEFKKTITKYITPNKVAIFIQTKAKNLSFPFEYKKTNNGYILFGDNQQIENYLNNNFYAPDDAEFKEIKVAIIDYDKYYYETINNIQKHYKTCKIKKIIFLTPSTQKLITKPTNIKLDYKVILDCNVSHETKGY